MKKPRASRKAIAEYNEQLFYLVLEIQGTARAMKSAPEMAASINVQCGIIAKATDEINKALQEQANREKISNCMKLAK
jgi:hypothetical protein